MQSFFCEIKESPVKTTKKETMAKSRKDAALKMGVPLKYVQLQTRKQ